MFYICSNKIDKMKNNLLIAHKFKVTGWVVFIVFALIGLSKLYLKLDPTFLKFSYGKCDGSSLFDCSEINFLTTIALAGTIVGLLLISFSKTKNEDEYISFLRLKSWQWSVLISYIVLIIVNFCVYSSDFLAVMMYNMFTVLVVFIIKFNYSLYRLKKEGGQDEK